MFRKNDFILLLVIFTSMGVGIAFPAVGKPLSPYTFPLMIFLLFFSFLKIDFTEAFHHVRETASVLFVLCLFKLFVVPVCLFFVTHVLRPDYGLPVLLLSGISTGVVAPFISDLLNASTLLVLIMVVVSSLIVPFSLPALVKLLVGRTIEISFFAMVKILMMVVFIPAAGAVLIRRLSPSFSAQLEKIQSPVSLVIFACINLGVFSKYSSFFMTKPLVLAEVIVVAFILSAVFHIMGYVVTWGRKKEDRLAGAISFACMNNVLIVVFASEFFGPLAPTLAAIYILPFFVMIVPGKMAAKLIR